MLQIQHSSTILKTTDLFGSHPMPRATGITSRWSHIPVIRWVHVVGLVIAARRLGMNSAVPVAVAHLFSSVVSHVRLSEGRGPGLTVNRYRSGLRC